MVITVSLHTHTQVTTRKEWKADGGAFADSPQGRPLQTLRYRWAGSRRYLEVWATADCEETTDHVITRVMHSGMLS